VGAHGHEPRSHDRGQALAAVSTVAVGLSAAGRVAEFVWLEHS